MSAGGAESDGTFFCSELVAEGLKVLKVLPRGKASAQFWPSAFSAEHRPPIELAEDAAFGQQLTIDFDLADRYEGAEIRAILGPSGGGGRIPVCCYRELVAPSCRRCRRDNL